MKVLIVVNADWYFWSHRLPLARALKSRGYEVVVVAGEERGFRPRIEQEGFRFVPLQISRGSMGPFAELATFRQLLRIYRAERPHVVHHVSIKPVLYGSLAAKFARRPAVINTVAGLGYAFLPEVRKTVVGRLASLLYRIACSGRETIVICQNPEDRQALVAMGAASPERVALIRGSGVDVEAFAPTEEPGGVPIVLLAGRLFWDKGVREFVEAARILRSSGIPHRAVMVGIPDVHNPNSVPEDALRAWQSEGLIEWWGLREDMPSVIAQSVVVTLPTFYPEGVPKILIEAASSARAIVATDVPGCREIARAGINADLVVPKDADALAAAIAGLLAEPGRRRAYGRAGRAIAVEEFSDGRVLGETLGVYDRLLKTPEAATA